MRSVSIIIAGLLVACGPAAAQPQTDGHQVQALLRILGSEIVAIRPYPAIGIELRRGFEMDTRPRQNGYGDCRSQRITFFKRFYPQRDPRAQRAEPELDQLVLANRYRRPGWRQTEAPRDCGLPSEGVWTVAKDDYTFFLAARALGRVATEAQGGGADPLSYHFRYTCAELGFACADPGGRLKNALLVTDAEASLDGRTVLLVGTQGAYRIKMWITTGDGGRVERVDLDYALAPLS